MDRDEPVRSKYGSVFEATQVVFESTQWNSLNSVCRSVCPLSIFQWIVLGGYCGMQLHPYRSTISLEFGETLIKPYLAHTTMLTWQCPQRITGQTQFNWVNFALGSRLLFASLRREAKTESATCNWYLAGSRILELRQFVNYRVLERHFYGRSTTNSLKLLISQFHQLLSSSHSSSAQWAHCRWA